MKFTKQALDAKRNNVLTDVVIKKESGNQHLIFLFEDNFPEMNYVKTDTEIEIMVYGHNQNQDYCSFLLRDVQHFNSPVKTFLKKINKNSDVKFLARKGNVNQYEKDANLQKYELFGIINDNYFLLDTVVMPENIASPIK